MSITPREVEWVSAFLEGEGSFCGPNARRTSLTISAPQRQLWPLEKLQRLLGGRICQRGVPYEGIYCWYANNNKAAGIMMTIFSLMSPDRKNQIKKALAAWMERKQKLKPMTVWRRNNESK